MPRAQTLSRRDHCRSGSLTRKLSTLCRVGWSVGVMSSAPPVVALRKPQASQPERKCFVAELVVGIHVDVGVAGDDHRVPSTEAARDGVHWYVGPQRRPSRPEGAACLRPVDVEEGEATRVCVDFQGRCLCGDEFVDADHFVLSHVPPADCSEEAPPPRWRWSPCRLGGC